MKDINWSQYDQKYKRVSLRFNPDDYRLLEQKAEKMGLPIATYCKHVSLNKAILIKKVIPKSKSSNDFELHKIGVNLNQIVKKLNIEKNIDQILNEEIEIILKKIESKLNK